MNRDLTPEKSIEDLGNQENFVGKPVDDQHRKSKVIPHKLKSNADHSENSLESVSKYEYSDSYKKLELIQTSKDDKLKGKDADPFQPAKD